MEKALKKKNLIKAGLLFLLAIAVAFILISFYSQLNPGSTVATEETYRVVADDDDGPEQIFQKAFTLYSNEHNIKVSEDESRKVAEYMAEQNLRGKAYWTDANGQRHELWIGTRDTLTLRKNSSIFNISNAITENQKKTVIIYFGFEEALAQLDVIRAGS